MVWTGSNLAPQRRDRTLEEDRAALLQMIIAATLTLVRNNTTGPEERCHSSIEVMF